jgi:vancomycin resistance protein YoaR
MLKKKILVRLPKIIFLDGPWRIASLSILLLILVGITVYNVSFSGKIYPGVEVAGISVARLTPVQAELILSEKVKYPQEIVLVAQGQQIKIPTSSFSLDYDFSGSAKEAYYYYRSGNIFLDLYQSLLASTRKVNLPLIVKLDEAALNKSLSVVAEGVSVEPVYPSVRYSDEEVLVERGKEGSELDSEAARGEIIKGLGTLDPSPIYLKIAPINPTIDEEEAAQFGQRATKLIGKSLEIGFEQELLKYKEDQIFRFLSPKNEYDSGEIEAFVEELSQKFNREPENPTFVFEEGRVKEFAASKTGVEVDKKELGKKIPEALSLLESSDKKTAEIELPVALTQPKIQTGDVNNLGIKELIGRGTSTFRGSIANRIHNISLASSKFKGILIAPKETFSFNYALGDVSTFTGYKQAFVIKDGKTVLGDGGGVCQVSTTFFRAALNAGLPIVERRAHSYRVGYYEQDSPPGIDATVYAPTTDLKILNDTPGHILIQPVFDAKTSSLAFEFYGTSDGRVAKISKPVVSGVTAPPEDLYIDDPTLPTGQIKQIDFKAWGARVSFDYSVERNGEIIYDKTFLSNFRPWQAVFLRGTAITP